MKYLKYFESEGSKPESLMIKYADDIARVLSIYSNNFDDSLATEVDSLIWKSDAATARYDDTEIIDEECIRILIEDLKGGWDREISKLLDVYYDCIPFVKGLNKDYVSDLKEIFWHYTDEGGKVNINKSSSGGDDRYVVQVRIDDAFVKIDFQEALGRVKDILGFDKYSISGGNDVVTIEFYKPFDDEEDTPDT